MHYLKFHPCKQLEPFVECYFLWQSGNEPVKDLVVESPPTGFCSIVFNSGDRYFLESKKHKMLPVPAEFVSGQSIYSYKLFLTGNIAIAGIVFKPAGLATLYNWPMHEFTEERIELKTLFPAKLISEYASAIAEAKDANQKAHLLEAFVLRQFEMKKPVPDYIDQAASLIIEKNGMLQVNELVETIYMSRRNFERRFLKKVGLSPKYYARIRRISYLANLISGKRKADWAKLFNDCAYYDQSHFIKDFLEFTGRTPQQYLEENRELANYVEKPKEQTLS